MRQRWRLAIALLRADHPTYVARCFSNVAAGSVPEDLPLPGRSKEAAPGWQQLYWRTPPMDSHPAEGLPTALSWLRRRGPGLPDSVLHRLFRQRQVKMVEEGAGGAARRVGPRDSVPRDAALLVPLRSLDSKENPTEASRQVSPAAAEKHAALVAACGEELRGRVLHLDQDLLVLDKPPGLPVQGGSGRRRAAVVSLDGAMAHALRFGAIESPRLVHRLDRDTSGAMVVARHAASAAWLSAAFARKSGAGTTSSAAGRLATSTRRPTGPDRWERHRLRDGDAGLPWVSRTYWAIVEAGWQLPDRGTISDPVVTQQDGQRVVQRAETHYRTLAQERGMAWLELTPVTGRKHQLRLHCSHALGCVIIGDGRHGTRHSPLQRALPDLMASSQAASATTTDGPARDYSEASRPNADSQPSEDSQPGSRCTGNEASGTVRGRENAWQQNGKLQLHARSLTIHTGVRSRDGQSRVHVEAEPPEHMRQLLDALGWRHQTNTVVQLAAPSR